MEASLFNIDTTNNSGEHILFNTLRSSLAVLNEKAYSQYKALDGEHLPALKDAGFVVDSVETEAMRQAAAFDRDRNDRDTLSLCLAPTYQCNLACTFCYERDQIGPGNMTTPLMDDIMLLVEKIYARDHFSHLFVTWYGGEPTLCMDVLESLTERFVEFSRERGIEYGAEIITNATLVDEDMASRLKELHISYAMSTFAGCKELHNCRRADRGGQDSFSMTKAGIENLRDADINVGAMVNIDKLALEDFYTLREWASEQVGIEAIPTMLRDYLGDLEKDTDKQKGYDLFSREEFSWLIYELQKEGSYDCESIRATLSPIRNFCRGQLENYFVIDRHGGVYKCDGWMGYEEHKLFDIQDDVDVEGLITTDYNPSHDPLCRDCAILPLCKGQCSWDRELFEEGCHPLKYTIDSYVKDYRNCFGEATGDVTVFVHPIDLEDFFGHPFTGDGLTYTKYPNAG